jgi:hypothetical protein
MVKGPTKENLRKLFKWDKGDLFWLIFFALLFFLIYSYYTETLDCREIINDQCYKACKVNEFSTEFNIQHSHIKVSCDEDGNCIFSGVQSFETPIPTNISIDILENATQ